MTRSRSLCASRLAALTLLATVLVVPAAHGFLAHGHVFCHDVTTLESTSSAALPALEAGFCPTCFASGPARSAVATSIVASPVGARPLARTALTLPPLKALDLALAAPRAPPATP